MSTVTIGVVWSSDRITVSPFDGSVYRSNGIRGAACAASRTPVEESTTPAIASVRERIRMILGAGEWKSRTPLSCVRRFSNASDRWLARAHESPLVIELGPVVTGDDQRRHEPIDEPSLGPR